MLYVLNIISLIGEMVFGIMIVINLFNFTKLKNFIRNNTAVKIIVIILTFIGFFRFVILRIISITM